LCTTEPGNLRIKGNGERFDHARSAAKGVDDASSNLTRRRCSKKLADRTHANNAVALRHRGHQAPVAIVRQKCV
jgi:hypothetical protein